MLLDVSKKRRDQREREMKEKKLLRERLTSEQERETMAIAFPPFGGITKVRVERHYFLFPQRGFPFPTCIGYIVHELAARVSYAR